MEYKELITDKWVGARAKGGKVKVSLNVMEIYKSLRDFGLRFAYIEKVGHFYLRQNGIHVTNWLSIQDLVWNRLRHGQMQNKDLVLNAYLSSNPLKRGATLKHILRDNLTDEEKHLIKLQGDIEYRKRFEIEETIKTLKNLNFTKTVDQEGYFNYVDLYFKRKSGNEFTVLSHYTSKDILKHGFDCWSTEYKRETDIGKKEPISVESLKMSFHLEKDISLISLNTYREGPNAGT